MKTIVKDRCYFPPDLNWFEIPREDLKLESSKDSSVEKLDQQELLTKAKEIYESQCATFQSTRNISTANRDWFKNVVSSGTLRDKISALTIAVQECGIYSLPYVEQLLNMTKHQNNRESTMAIEGLREVFLERLLPSDRKLKYFEQQVKLHPECQSKRAFVAWYFEDAIKKHYLQFLRLLETNLKDTIPFNRTKILSIVWELFVAKPEQEQSLLALILNKLGDTDNKVSSKASYLLLLTSQKHSNMLQVLVRETRQAVVNPAASLRTIYYGLIFMNQIMLSSSVSNVANILIETYFESFQKILGMPSDQETAKCTSAILTGINRAFPFSKLDEALLKGYLDQLFQLVHGDNFNTSMQSLNLLFTISSNDASMQDRFYRTLYELLNDPLKLANSSKQPFFINLLFKALAADQHTDRLSAFFKRILHCAAFQQPPFICAALVLLSEIIKRKSSFLKRFSEQSLFASSSSTSSSAYDCKKRDPRFAGAEKSSLLCDLSIFQRHYHPTVVKYANALAAHQFIECPVDPFEKFTCAEFLDKFAYKNPKKQAVDESGVAIPKQRGISAMQPIKLPSESQSFQLPVNVRYGAGAGDQVASRNIPEDEQFFAQFFTSEVMQQQQALKKKRASKATQEEEDEVAEDMDEDAQIDKDFNEYLDANPHELDDAADGEYWDAEDGEDAIGEDEIDDEVVDGTNGEVDEFGENAVLDEVDDEIDGMPDDEPIDDEPEVADRHVSKHASKHRADADPADATSKRKKKKQALPLFAEAHEYLSD